MARRMYWDEIDGLIEQADSIEAKRELEAIQRHLYHVDEFRAGLD